jgi:hypothetical protein
MAKDVKKGREPLFYVGGFRNEAQFLLTPAVRPGKQACTFQLVFKQLAAI